MPRDNILPLHRGASVGPARAPARRQAPASAPVLSIEELRNRVRAMPFEEALAEPYDESEGLGEFFGDVRVWFSGFGFGAVAGCLFTTLAAYVIGMFL